MKRYKHSKKSTERVGFYVALSVCMMAVGLAVWSAYTTFSDDPGDDSYFSSLSSMTTAAAAQPMTGVTEAPTDIPATDPAPTSIPTSAPTQPAARGKSITLYESAPATQTDNALSGESSGELSSLQAVLRVADSLIYPVKSKSVLKQYSEDAVYSQTMKDYRSHPGCDFVAEQGESVYAMCGGTVKDISVSELYGVIIEVESDGFSVYYCGLSSDLTVEKGDLVATGDTVGTVAQIPCESADDSHIHIEVRVGSRLIDPLSVIDSDS
jgi:murein DD-endopeptidase MepM/ murein hydrolase activator NlpD